jgi:hypothetical protein
VILVGIRWCCGSTATRTYLWVELELDHISSVCLYIVGVEGERPIRPTDLDNMCVDSST